MNKVKLEILFTAVAKINLVEVIQNFEIDEQEVVEAIEANDTEKLNSIVEQLEENLHLAFKGQTDVNILDMDTERSSLNITYDDEVLTSNA